MQLQIEPLNACNADCVFCPYSRHTRKRQVMPMGLFRKIIDEAATIPLIDQITLTGLGEPLLDPHVIERIKYVRKMMREISVTLFTNGSKLTVDLAGKLAKAGLSTMYVSLNGVNARQRKEAMGLDDYDSVVKVLNEIIAAPIGEMAVVIKAIASKDLLEPGDSDTFQHTWGGATEMGGNAFLHLEGNWAGIMYSPRVKPRGSCARALDHIMVLSDGRVSMCCFDAEGKTIFGDLNSQTLREIYSSEKAVAYRRAHVEGRRQELELCKECTAI